jgi:hypothetical protein
MRGPRRSTHSRGARAVKAWAWPTSRQKPQGYPRKESRSATAGAGSLSCSFSKATVTPRAPKRSSQGSQKVLAARTQGSMRYGRQK